MSHKPEFVAVSRGDLLANKVDKLEFAGRPIAFSSFSSFSVSFVMGQPAIGRPATHRHYCLLSRRDREYQPCPPRVASSCLLTRHRHQRVQSRITAASSGAS